MLLVLNFDRASWQSLAVLPMPMSVLAALQNLPKVSCRVHFFAGQPDHTGDIMALLPAVYHLLYPRHLCCHLRAGCSYGV